MKATVDLENRNAFADLTELFCYATYATIDEKFKPLRGLQYSREELPAAQAYIKDHPKLHLVSYLNDGKVVNYFDENADSYDLASGDKDPKYFYIAPDIPEEAVETIASFLKKQNMLDGVEQTDDEVLEKARFLASGKGSEQGMA